MGVPYLCTRQQNCIHRDDACAFFGFVCVVVSCGKFAEFSPLPPTVEAHLDHAKGSLDHEFPCPQSVFYLARVRSCNLLKSDFDIRTSYLTSTWACAWMDSSVPIRIFLASRLEEGLGKCFHYIA